VLPFGRTQIARVPTLGPKLGDFVSHEGAFGKAGDENGAYRVIDFAERAVITDGEPKVVRFCRFANRRFTVTCLVDELEWVKEDGAWMLPGRLLSTYQKKCWMVMLGVKFPPAADKHRSARAFLKSEGVLK